MTSDAPLLSFRISVDYPKRPRVLRDVSLHVQRGEVVGLVGASGSGKSTVSLALLRLVSLKGGNISGEIVFEGQSLLTKSEAELRRIRGKRMSIVLQSPLASLNPALQIGAQLNEAWRAHENGTAAECASAIRAALRSAQLPDDAEFLRARPSRLSVGQAQRVNIAMAILHRPALMIADEATSALDTITQSEILNLFGRLSRDLQMAILYISHDLPSVATICDRVAILHEGELVEVGATHQIFTSPKHPYTQRLLAAIPKSPVKVSPDASLQPRELPGTFSLKNAGVRN